MVQIHEYMLSKAPPVPELRSLENAEGKSDNVEGEVQERSEDSGTPVTEEPPPNSAVADGVSEEIHEAPAHGNARSMETGTSREVPARVSSELPQRVQKPADDRLFTWAAVGLTIAIVVLLLKKFLKSAGHGTIFLDES